MTIDQNLIDLSKWMFVWLGAISLGKTIKWYVEWNLKNHKLKMAEALTKTDKISLEDLNDLKQKMLDGLYSPGKVSKPKKKKKSNKADATADKISEVTKKGQLTQYATDYDFIWYEPSVPPPKEFAKPAVVIHILAVKDGGVTVKCDGLIKEQFLMSGDTYTINTPPISIEFLDRWVRTALKTVDTYYGFMEELPPVMQVNLSRKMLEDLQEYAAKRGIDKPCYLCQLEGECLQPAECPDKQIKQKLN
jgi:hypothetical protein